MLKLHANNGVASRIFQRVELKLGYADESSNETYLGLTDEDFRATPNDATPPVAWEIWSGPGLRLS